VEKNKHEERQKGGKDRIMISRYRKGIMKWREKKQPKTE